MSDYQLGLSAVPLPVMYHVRQTFPAPQVANVELAVRAAVASPDIVTLLRPGLPKFDVDAAAPIVRSVFLAHLVAP